MWDPSDLALKQNLTVGSIGRLLGIIQGTMLPITLWTMQGRSRTRTI